MQKKNPSIQSMTFSPKKQNHMLEVSTSEMRIRYLLSMTAMLASVLEEFFFGTITHAVVEVYTNKNTVKYLRK